MVCACCCCFYLSLVLSLALKPAEVVGSSVLHVESYRTYHAVQDLATPPPDSAFLSQERGIGQLQVHFSSHKKTYTSIFLWGLDRILRPQERQPEGWRGIMAHFAPHKDQWAHLKRCCLKASAQERLSLDSLKGTPEDFRRGSSEDAVCLHTTDLCLVLL